MRTSKTLIRLGGCPGCSESSVGAHAILLVLSRGGSLLHIEVRLPVLLCAVKTVEGDFRFCWAISPNVGQTCKENPNLVRIFYYDIYFK